MQRHESQQLVDALFTQIAKESRVAPDSEHPTLSESSLETLISLFPSVAYSALHIVDQGKVTKFICQQSKRVLYRVKEPQAQGAQTGEAVPMATHCDVLNDFCFCFFFVKNCLGPQSSAMLCKHILAVKLAEAFSQNFDEKLQVKEIED